MANSWIGVDLDGTLAEYTSGQFPLIGKPIQPMLDRVKGWLAKGIEVRIVTARASMVRLDLNELREQLALIDSWLEEHVGHKLPITCSKDFDMISLWDDRCVQVEFNTGRVLGVDVNA
jgi:hypothetical protein